MWETTEGKLVRQLKGHGHWVNTLGVSTEHALRTGPFDHTGKPPPADPTEAKALAQKRYDELKGARGERLVSGSDDFTMFLWEPEDGKKPLARMTGHQQLINQVQFSPNGLYICSASFDKSVKLWDGLTGKFLSSFFGHVGPVYQVWKPRRMPHVFHSPITGKAGTLLLHPSHPTEASCESPR